MRRFLALMLTLMVLPIAASAAGSSTCEDKVFPPTPFCSGPTRYDARDMRYRRATLAGTNDAGVGPASAASFSATPTTIGNGSLASVFGWTRTDQGIDLLTPSGFSFPETSTPSIATITFEISKP